MVFKDLIKDLKELKNIELYLTILISTIVLLLDIFGIVVVERIFECILGIMALMSFGMLSTRKSIESLTSTSKALHLDIEDLKSINTGRIIKSGIVDAYLKASHLNLDRLYRNAQQSVRILQTWFPQADPFPPGLIESIRKGIQIKQIWTCRMA